MDLSRRIVFFLVINAGALGLIIHPSHLLAEGEFEPAIEANHTDESNEADDFVMPEESELIQEIKRSPIPGGNEEAAAKESGKRWGVLGPVRIGPSFAVTLPHPIKYGVDLIYKDYLSLAFTTGKFSLDLDEANIQLAHWDFRARWHVFRGSFFLGAAYGQQNLFAEANDDVKLNSAGLSLTIPTTVQIEMETKFVTPHLGWLWVWKSGFNMGFEIGAQIPMGSTDAELRVAFENVSSDQDAEVKNSKDYKDLEKAVEDAGKLLGKTVLPYVTLFRIGWVF